MILSAVSVLAFLAVSNPLKVPAAGFDCSKAKTKMEKLLCDDLELSSADDRLSQLYKKVLAKSKERDKLIAAQREWLKKRNAFSDREVLLKLYKDRTVELEGPVLVPLRSLTSTCDGFLKRNDIDDISACRVSETGRIGTVGNKTYRYALYCLLPEGSGEPEGCSPESYHGKRGMSVYVQDGASPQLKLFLDRGSYDIGLYIYRKPEIVQNSFGKLLYLPIVTDGTGNFNESDYFIWDEGIKGWKYLDGSSWLTDLQKEIPRDTHVASGVWPDLATMTAEVFLSHENDPNCCPSGGKALVTLAIKEGRFRITSVKLVKDDDQ
nr:lysozyme inhibitor LprI family protein [Geomonas sp. Red32]